MKKKILIVYGSVGLGHKVVAENIAAVLKTRPELEVFMLDALELYRGPFTNISAKIYEFIIKYLPFLWAFFYTNRIFQTLTLPLRLPLAAFKSAKFDKYVKEIKPQLIITTHPTATALTINLKKQGLFSGPIITTFSDFHFQPYWVYQTVDKYLVMTAEQKQELVKRGFHSEQVFVTGLPVDPVFTQNFDRGKIFAEIGLAKSLPIILVMGGSRGWGVKVSDIKALLLQKLPAQIVVVTGINPELASELKLLERQAAPNLKIFANWSNSQIAKLFSIASLLITKPGGLTIGQAVLKNLPMVLVNPLPAMEELNQDYLLSHGAAIAARDVKELVMGVQRLLKDPRFRQELKTNMQSISNPDASTRAALVIIDSLYA